jgi:hypothetical protein
VAGLLAETGRTLRQSEFTALVSLAALPSVDPLLLSADRFGSLVVDGAPAPEVRARLVERLGLFGVRLGISLVRSGTTTPDGLAAALVEHSGLTELRAVLETRFAERRTVLKARSALLALEWVLAQSPDPALSTELEQIVSGAHEFVELRTLAALRAGTVRVPEVAEAERLLGGSGAAAAVRLGRPADATVGELREAALEAVRHWQRRAESPLASRATADAARVVVRSCEGMLAGLRPSPRPRG